MVTDCGDFHILTTMISAGDCCRGRPSQSTRSVCRSTFRTIYTHFRCCLRSVRHTAANSPFCKVIIVSRHGGRRGGRLSGFRFSLLGGRSDEHTSCGGLIRNLFVTTSRRDINIRFTSLITKTICHGISGNSSDFCGIVQNGVQYHPGKSIGKCKVISIPCNTLRIWV